MRAKQSAAQCPQTIHDQCDHLLNPWPPIPNSQLSNCKSMAQTKIGGSKVAAGKLGISVEKYIQNVHGYNPIASAKTKVHLMGRTVAVKFASELCIKRDISQLRSNWENPEDSQLNHPGTVTKVRQGLKSITRLRVINYRTHVTYLVSIAVILVAIVYTNMTITNDTMLSII